MTVKELVAELEDMNPDAEVRFAMQPNYPLEYALHRVEEVDLYVSQDEDDYTVDEERDPESDYTVDDKAVVYLVEGTQIGYLPGCVQQQLGW